MNKSYTKRDKVNFTIINLCRNIHINAIVNNLRKSLI